MSDTALRGRLSGHAAGGRFRLFVVGGGLLALVGAALFALSLSGEAADRAEARLVRLEARRRAS